MKTFSVIIPIYKVEAYVVDTIKSVIGQQETDYELVVVDDGSPDNSCIIAANLLSSTNLDYRIIKTENRGVSAARNTGLEHCSGEYVIMVDGDDILADDFLITYRRLVNMYPGSDIYSTSFTIYSMNKIIEQPTLEMPVMIYEAKHAQTAFFHRHPRFLLPTMMFKRSFLNEHHIRFDKGVRYSEDVQFIWRTLAYNHLPVIHSSYSGYKYILHPGSTMTASSIGKIITWHEGFEKLHKEIHGLLSEDIIEAFVPQGYFSMLHGITHMISYKNFKEIYDKIDCARMLHFNGARASYKVKLVAILTNLCPRLGYCIMKFF